MIPAPHIRRLDRNATKVTDLWFRVGGGGSLDIGLLRHLRSDLNADLPANRSRNRIRKLDKKTQEIRRGGGGIKKIEKTRGRV
jgi:hypothetical protein